MTIKEEKRDLFTMPKDYALAHCISADFALGAGIAKEFDKRFNCRRKLFDMYKRSLVPRWDKIPNGCSVILLSDHVIFNLVTKRNYWNKPTLDTIKNALDWMKDQCEMYEINKVAMPRIGCGLDRQNWSDVKSLIEKVFADLDIEIVVCNL